MRLATATLPAFAAAVVWLSLGPYPWPVNPYPYAWPVNPYPGWVRWVAALLAGATVLLAGSQLGPPRRLRAWMGRHAVGLMLGGMALSFAYGWASGLLRLASFDANLMLAIFTSICWNTLHGRPYEWFGGNYLAVHLTLVPMVEVPLCAVGRGAPGVLLGHSLLLTLPALPLFLLARRRLEGFSALVLGLAYLLLPGVFSQYTLGGSEAPVIALPLALAFLFYDQARLKPFLCAVAFGAAGVVEYYAPAFAVFALLAWRSRRSWPWIASPLALALVWPPLAYGLLLPALGGDVSGSGLQHYRHLGESPAAILFGIATAPDSLLALLKDHFHLGFLYQLLIPFLFVLPWGSGEALFAVYELVTILPTSDQNILSLSGAHVGLASVALLAGSVGTLGRLFQRGHEASRRLARSLAATVLSLSAASITTVAFLTYPVNLVRHPRPALAEAVALVPPDVTVAVPEGVLPHVVDRLEVYLSGRQETMAAAETGRLAAALVYHPAGQIVPEEEKRFLEFLGSHPLYRLAFERDGVVLFLLEP